VREEGGGQEWCKWAAAVLLYGPGTVQAGGHIAPCDAVACNCMAARGVGVGWVLHRDSAVASQQ
jgi:hypothetical protein